MENYKAEANIPPLPRSEAALQALMQPLMQALMQALMRPLADCWESGDAKAYADLFTAEANYVTFDGVLQKGRAAIAAAHEPLFEKWLKGSRVTGEITSMRFLSPNVALIHAVGNTILAEQSAPAANRASIQTLVAGKRDGAWRFTAFYNTRMRPIGMGLGSVLAWRFADLAWKLLGPKTGLNGETQ